MPVAAIEEKAQSRTPEAGTTAASKLERLVKADIIAGRLRPGASLKLKDVAARYGGGVIPLREALSRLVASGMVVAEDQKGFRVAPVSRRELLDITRTRQQIEALALKEAVANGDVAWEARVLAAHHQLSRLPLFEPAAGTMHPDWERAHDAFHEAVLSGCGSDCLMRIARDLRDQSARYRHLSLRSDHGGKRDIALEHKAILDAVLARDAIRACQLLVAHFGSTMELVIKDYPDTSLTKAKAAAPARPRSRAKAGAA
ncbi:FCD domain-containing protein [Cupriavidus sp. 30B13]|uniref:FCD domain-containing protein n=1 Tax=Cupriavidus sp. 30B13 TaxID=3384241 RepID=UPI003B920C58